MRHRPRQKYKRIPQFLPNAALGDVDGVQMAQVAVVKETEMRLSPIERSFYGWPPGPCQPGIEGTAKALLRSIPHLSGQEATRQRHEQGFELAATNLRLAWEGEDAIELRLIEIGDADLERRQHTRSISLHETILTEVRF